MKVIVYMGQSLNGYITKDGDDTSFLSRKSWDGFEKHFQKAGNIIMGRTTFDISLRDGTFPYKKVLNIIMTRKPIENKWQDIAIFTDKSPKEVVELVKSKGFGTAFVAGGGKLNTGFLEAGLVDEIYVDIEPIIFGKGKPIFAPGNFENKLKLLETKMLSPDEIQLHYQVIK